MRRLIALSIALAALLAACGGDDAPSPTATPAPSETATASPPTLTPFPTFTPTPEVTAGQPIVVGGDVRLRAEPNTRSAVVGELPDHAPLRVHRAVRGENWLVGSQTWVSTSPEWASTWYELDDGSYIYAAFVFWLQPGEVSPLLDPGGAEKWIDVNVTTQTARAMVGDQAVYVAPISSGSPQFPSPLGSHRIEKGGRLAVERMTAAQAGYTPQQATYDVERVLFTQYYDLNGNALHLNYWRPASVFGRQATSHGCIGMQLHDAQYFWLFAEEGMRVEIHA